MSGGNWLLIAVVAASTLIGTAVAITDLAIKRRAAAMSAAPGGELICEATDGIWTCTRPPRHKGDHASHGKNDTVPIRTWPRKPGENQ